MICLTSAILSAINDHVSDTVSVSTTYLISHLSTSGCRSTSISHIAVKQQHHWHLGLIRKRKQQEISRSAFVVSISAFQILLQASASRAPVFRLIRMSLKSTCESPRFWTSPSSHQKLSDSFPEPSKYHGIPSKVYCYMFDMFNKNIRSSSKHQRIQKRDLNMSTCANLSESQP